MVFKIAIEGNVASGKSSIVSYMKKNFENVNARTTFKVDENIQTTNSDEFENSNEYEQIKLNRAQSYFLRPNINVKLIAEPVPNWRNLNGHNLFVMSNQLIN
jgi:deoxyadenosine/deoxycytidine kinase